MKEAVTLLRDMDKKGFLIVGMTMFGENKKKWIKLVKNLLILTLFFAMQMPTVVRAAASAENGSGAESSAEALRNMQADIVKWKQAANGEEQFLDGELLDGAGNGGSDWFAFDISRMGLEDNQAAYLSRMKDVVENIYQNLEGSEQKYRLSDIYRMILTIEACGGDPTNFGTDAQGKGIDLVNDYIWNSIWGDPGNQGINGYIWALLAVDSKNWEEPDGALWTREQLITSLLSRQLADGGFGLVLTDASDVDLTTMTLTALAPYKDSKETYSFTSAVTEESVTTTVAEAAEKAFACISDMQHEDGSMLTYGQRTSESTSWAMMALASWGRDPETDEQFIKNGHTLLDGLWGFRLEDGSIIHSLDGEEETTGNNMASYQALYGLEAVCRLKEGKCLVFDLSDGPVVSAEEIEAAGAELPELRVEEEEKSQAEVQADTDNRTILITACVAGAVVLVVILFLVLVLKDRKKKKNRTENAIDDDDDEDW